MDYCRSYALLRKWQPEVVVETGVRNGASSACYLSALERNGRGRLYSVDLPDYKQLPEGRKPGWMVPDEWRDRWELRLGPSQRELPRLLEKLGEVNVFFHDSDHSAPTMMFEFELIWSYLSSPGLIVSAAIYMSTEFWDFAQARTEDLGRISMKYGYRVKP